MAQQEEVPTFLTVSETTHDYGTLEKGGNPYCEFVLKNTAKIPVAIDTAIGSCGCTVPQYPKEPIAPGKTAIIKVKYDTQRVGPFAKSVTVRFEQQTETLVLHIKGKIELPPADQPFGSQPVNTGAPLEQHNQ